MKLLHILSLLALALSARAEDLAPFQAADKLYGYKDAAGAVVIAPKFSTAGQFREGLALVTLRGRYGFVGRDGKTVVPLKYNYARPFKDGVAVAQLDEQPLLLNTQGEEIVKPGVYTSIGLFSEGRSAVSIGGEKGSGLGGKWGYLNTKGELVIPAELELATMFQKGRAWVKQGGKSFYIDVTGKQVK